MKEELISKAIDTATGIANDVIDNSLAPCANDFVGAVSKAIRDTFYSAALGQRTINDWANIVIGSVDNIKSRYENKYGWTYVGGKLNFTMPDISSRKVVIAFELYYLDTSKKWHKVGGSSNVYTSNFTPEALNEIQSKQIVSFEVN